ncbi:MAG: patatin-like phospholipase family protein [Planctomycetes bacterium]|nr:patatin-like phospholipase family protein [Planctomycetota bacterium]
MSDNDFPPTTNGSTNGHGSMANGRPKRPRTILVLGGGGMKGFAHIGVMRALERLGIEVDEVVGTSMGAVMGGLFAQGRDSQSIEAVAQEISVKDYLKLNLLKFLVKGYRHASVYKGRRFLSFLEEHFGDQRFEDLDRPFVCNALSLTRGHMRYFGLPGDAGVRVAEAVYASSCLPGVYEPPRIGEDHYIDGGMAETLSLKIAHMRKAELVIAVDLSIRDQGEDTPFKPSLPHILFQTYNIMGAVLNEHNLHRYVNEHTVLMKPPVSEFGLLEQPDLTELVRIGEREALEVLSTHPLTRYLSDPAVMREVDRTVPTPRDYVRLDVDANACIHCGICASICATQGYADVARGNVVRKVHNYECTRDAACERNCPTGAIRLFNL